MNVWQLSHDEASGPGLALVGFKLVLAFLILARVPVHTIISIALVGGVVGLVLAIAIKVKVKSRHYEEPPATPAPSEPAPISVVVADPTFVGGARDWWFGE
jgi:hypothetical protein